VTVILKRGDSVHLAVPLNTGPGGTASTQKMVDQVIEMYAQMGVHVAGWTAGSLTRHFVIVAVFREE
jgi:hypothetical protein